jgi:hypothetical protein
MNYLGLTGIEIFDVEGNQLQISENNILRSHLMSMSCLVTVLILVRSKS